MCSTMYYFNALSALNAELERRGWPALTVEEFALEGFRFSDNPNLVEGRLSGHQVRITLNSGTVEIAR